MTRLSEDKWEEFSENASLVYAYGSDNADNAPIGDKRIRVDATNWVIYNTIKEELEQEIKIKRPFSRKQIRQNGLYFNSPAFF